MRVKFVDLGIEAVSWSQPIRQFLVILAFCCSFLLASPLSATNYYVTQSGSGTQNGLSLANAWSVAAYLSLGSNNNNVPSGGDTVFFSGTITSAIVVASSGTGNGTGRLTLDFSGSCGGCTVVTFSSSISANLIQINNQNFLTFNGGGNGTLGGAGATWTTGSSNNMFMCKLSNGTAETAHDITINGFTYIGPTTGTGDFYQNGLCTFITITNNYADNVGHLVNSYQGSVHDITILNNFGRTSVDTTQDDDVIQISDAVNVTIQGNKLVDQAPGSSCCHNDVIQTFSSGSTTHQNPSNWIIAYNWIESAQVAGSGGNESFMELQNYKGQPALQIYDNVFVGTGVSQSGGNGISLHSGTNASDTYFFYNNTVWRHQMPLNPIRLGEGDGPGTVFIKNNASGSDASGQSWQVTFTIGAANNNFNYQLSGCPGSCGSLTPSAFVNISTNCLLNCTDNFTSAAGSVLINAGDSSIGAAYSQGICAGATWPNPALCARAAGAWDAGAFQLGTTVALSPPTGLTAVVH